MVAVFGTVASNATSGDTDYSEYRVDTYGPPDYYVDCTRSLASDGAGTLGDPWNMLQAMSEPVAGDVVGWLPVGAGTPVDLPSYNGVHGAAFMPANSGTIGNPIVHVTKYAAAQIVNQVGKASIGSSANRTELRHDGSAPSISGGAGNPADTGGPTLGAINQDYVTFDGFYIDVAHAYLREDSGVLRIENTQGIQFKNFAIKGTDVACASNCVLYRPDNALDTVLSNFYAWDMSNSPTGSSTPQASLFSDQYGDQNFLIEHFDIDNCGLGIFLKGTAVSATVFNYGTIRYGIVRNCASPIRFNDLDATNTTTVQYCLFYNTVTTTGTMAVAADGVVFDSISTAARNFTLDHCTIAKVDSTDINLNGAISVEDNGLGSNVVLTNNLIDMDSGSYGHQIALLSQLPATLNYNFYYKNGSAESYVYNGTQYNSFASWQAAISGRDANSVEGASSPFVDRASDDYRVSVGHAAKTMSSTGGEVGCYATSETIGVLQ